MGFGDFAMGYFLGQSFAGPTGLEGTVPHPSTWMPGKCQGDIDAENDPAVIAAGEKAYWKAWDAAYKENTIRDLRDHKPDSIPTLRGESIFEHLTHDRVADLIENKEIYIVHFHTSKMVAFLWTDENREEAQSHIYKDFLQKVKAQMNQETFRVVS